MLEAMFWGFVVRFLQSLFQASPFILVGFFISGVLYRLIGDEGTRRLFGGNTRSSLLQAWLIGMLLPVCALGVIPVCRQLRRAGLAGGTILAFAMAAPLFNPLSVLYGLSLSEPIAILAFAFSSLIVLTASGLFWDWLFPGSEKVAILKPPMRAGLKRILAIGDTAARESVGPAMTYIAIGLVGVALLGVILPSGSLQRAMNGDNVIAPLTMTAVAIPVYATPMLAMSQLGSMFQHANSPGAAFVLLVLGAGMNLGLAGWMWREYGTKRTVGWFGLLTVIVVGLAYGIDRPLFPRGVEVADHSHAFDIYCQPFSPGEPHIASRAYTKLSQDIQTYEVISSVLLLCLMGVGVVLNIVERRFPISQWLEQAPPSNATSSRYDFEVPGPVLGLVALVGLAAVSIMGCFTFYPAPDEVLEQMRIVRAEALNGSAIRDKTQACYWIDIYDDWSRKLEVGVYLREWELSDYHHWKARLLREKLELLKHEIEDEEEAEIRKLVGEIAVTHSRLVRAYRPNP